MVDLTDKLQMTIRKVLITSLLLHSLPLLAEIQVGIFLPTWRSPKEIENAIKGDKALKKMKPVVFAKYKEFLTSNKGVQFPILIVPKSHAEYGGNCTPILQFQANNSKQFKFAFVSLDKKWKSSNIIKGKLGVVDELGRKNMKKFTQQVSGIKFKKIKRVTKVEDLVPLLALGNVDHIMIRPDNLKHAKTNFKSTFYEIMKSNAVSNPIVCVSDQSKKSVAMSFKKMSKSTLKKIGFSSISE
ncbi:MAG: hypothetical protein AB8G05_08460 [Oligoflexales bacterium]